MSHSFESPQRKAGQSRKVQRLLRLGQKFKWPMLVCFVDSPASSMSAAADWDGVPKLPKHLLAQWVMDVPIILLVLAEKISYGIFGVWLGDKIATLDRTRFVLALQNEGRNRRYEVGANELVRGRIIDRTISLSPHLTALSEKAILLRLRNLMVQTLEEVTGDSPKELRARREDKLARVEAMIAKVCRQQT